MARGHFRILWGAFKIQMTLVLESVQSPGDFNVLPMLICFPVSSVRNSGWEWRPLVVGDIALRVALVSGQCDRPLRCSDKVTARQGGEGGGRGSARWKTKVGVGDED